MVSVPWKSAFGNYSYRVRACNTLDQCSGDSVTVTVLVKLPNVLPAQTSMIAITLIYGPSLVRANGQSGYIAAQPVSLPVSGYSVLKPRILATAKMCGIGRPDTTRAVMVDDLTYFTFMESHLPQHRLGVTGLWKGSMTDPIAYLKGRGSSGAVLGCHLLPPDLRARARGDGKFCCLAPPNW